MKIIIILAIILFGVPMALKNPLLFLIIAPAIGFIINSDKTTDAVDSFFSLGFAFTVIVGVVAFARNLLS